MHKSAAGLEHAPSRAIVESVRPEVDCGRFPIKRVVGEEVLVEADVFTDGHDAVRAELLFRFHGEKQWHAKAMEFVGNDHWRASFVVEELGRYEYTVRGWTDRLLTWQRDLEKRRRAGQDLSVDAVTLNQQSPSPLQEILSETSKPQSERYEAAVSAAPPAPRDEEVTTYERTLEVVVDPVKARFSSWYEMFPRSARGDGRHATFRDVLERLPHIAGMGFDVLYFPPIHPIGSTARKGKNNAVVAEEGDVGSPWAIGAKEGGHKAIHPDLGSFEDFDALVQEASRLGIDIALDVAFQTSPDHPYVTEHPNWFRWRPDGTVQYAENPPKKYQDIYPFEFESDQWPELFDELKSVFEFWVSRKIRIFRVDNPHTKPFAFWEWCIGELKAVHPELIFLSEAFTRPRVMHRLAKLGFTQSYTYFTWRNTKQELVSYFEELSHSASREYFRPNCWPNTPDILHEALQRGGRAAFITRAVLAATLSANWGIYGPAYELMENTSREAGSEEYLNSEKYEVKRWDLEDPNSLGKIIARLNAIRKANPALQSDWSLRFHTLANDQLICYSKSAGPNLIFVAVNLDPHNVQSGWVELPLAELDIPAGEELLVEDLLGGGRYLWKGAWNYVELSPFTLPAHVFRVHRRSQSGSGFDSFA
ncbi:MAG: alpha-1,4-glucan--maltose-1-phosphate maltosyltransferase [Betaproteobacteria bacterium]|nr:alpha-1,4-glucan--maltose-1-phosphate maltosyltransferase [Betaproteobacteria bacterium]